MALTAEVAYYLGLGALQVLLAVVLLGLRFYDRANRALALLLLLRGGFHLAGAVDDALRVDDAAVTALDFLDAHLFMAYLVSIAYFASVYPRPRRWLPPAPWGAAPFLAVMALGSALLALRVAPGPDGFPVWFGPYADLLEVVFPVAALVWARDALAMPAGSRRSSVLLVGVAFVLIDLYDNLAGALEDARFGVADPLVSAVTVVNLALFAALAVLLVRAERRTGDAALRAGLRRYLGAIGLTLASAVAVVPFTPSPGEGPAGTVAALWDLALPVLLTYALLRRQLFDIDLKAKWTIRQSTVAAAFVGVFFVASEGAQSFFTDTAGSQYLGIAAAGVLVFALAPLQRAAERVADAALPNVRAASEMSPDERRDVYRRQAALAWSDGAMSLDERQLLDGLREHLGLGADEAARLEREATQDARRRTA